MFHIVAFRPGDALLSTSGSWDSLRVHAARRQDGLIGVMLINKDPAAKTQVKLAINGVNLAGNGLRFVYDPDQVKQASVPSARK